MIKILVAAWGVSPALSFVACWGPQTLAPASPLEPRRDVTVHAFAGLARKIKEKEVSALQESAPAEWFQARGKRPLGKAVGESLRKRPGTVSLVAEYRRKGAGSGLIAEQLPPYIVSREFRTGGAQAVSLLLDASTGGCTVAVSIPPIKTMPPPPPRI